MGTRGFFGFATQDREVLSYVQFGAYPEGLGSNMIDYIRSVEDWDGVRDQVLAMTAVSSGVPPTPGQQKELASYADLNVGNQSLEDWYCLLRNTQGNPSYMLSSGHFESASEFALDSLFAEYGYVIDLESMAFEFYAGFQKNLIMMDVLLRE